MKKLNNPTENFVSKRINQRRVRRWVALLSALVLFLTVNTLKLEADTLERIATCGIEQHVHDESCYDASGALICGLAEHAHTDACFQQRPQRHDLTRVDGFMPLNAKVTLATPMPRLASNSADGQDAVQAEADYYSDIPTEVGSGIEPPVDEIQTELAGEEAAPAVEDAVPLEIVYEDQAEETVQQPEYVINGSTVLLSDILSALGMKVSGIQSAGELEGDTLAETPVNFAVEATQNDYELRVLRDFDAADLAVMTDDEVIVITLKNGIAPVEDNDDENPSENDDINIEETHTGETDDEAAAEETVDEETEDSADEATVDELTEDSDDAETEEAADETTVDATEEETVETVEETETAAVVPDKLVALDFADYDCLADATVYFYAPDRGAVLVNAEELAEADGVHLTVNAPVVLSMEADLGLAELEAALEEAPEDIDARIGENPVLFENGVLIISGDGELTVNGVTYSVTNVTLPSRSVESDNITISTVDDQATLLGVTPAFEDNGEDEGDIYALFAAQMDENIVTATSEEIQVDAIEPAKGLLRSSAMMAAEDAAPEAEEAVADAEETVEETGETETAEAAVETRTLKVRVYDVSLIREGESVEPDAPIHVETTFDAPLEGENFQLYHIVDGKPEEVDGFVKTDDQGRAIGMSFDTASLSPFAVVYYTVEYEIVNGEVTVKVDFTDIVQNGVDFDQNDVITALNDGVGVSIAELEQGYTEGTDNVVYGELYVDYTTADNKDSLVQKSWGLMDVVSADPGLSVVDGEIRVTADGTVVLSDGENTVTIEISNYERLLAEELSATGVDIEVLEGQIPAGSTAAYTALPDDHAADLVSAYNIEENKADAVIEDHNILDSATGYTAFDVTIKQPEGDDFTDAGVFAVSVDHPVDVEGLIPEGAKFVGVNYTLYHIHDGEATVVEDAAVVDGKVMFTTESFSEYVMLYTIDFTLDGYTFSYPGKIPFMLSDLLFALHIDVDAADVADIQFTNNDLFRVEQVEGDWEIEGIESFTTEEGMILTLVNGEKIYIFATDPVENPTLSLPTPGTNQPDGTTMSASVSKAVSGTEQNRNASFKVTVNYDLGEADFQTIKNADGFPTIVYDLNDYIGGTDDQGNPVPIDSLTDQVQPWYDKLTNTLIGQVRIEDNQVIMTITNLDWLDEQDQFGAKFDIQVNIDETKLGIRDEYTFKFPGTGELPPIHFKELEYQKSKSYQFNQHNDNGRVVMEKEDGQYKIHYTVDLTSPIELDTLNFTDTITGKQKYTGNVTITDPTGHSVTEAVNPGSQSLNIDVKSALGYDGSTKAPAGRYTVTYTTVISEEDLKSVDDKTPDTDADKETNSANWNVGGDNNITPPPTEFTPHKDRVPLDLDKNVTNQQGHAANAWEYGDTLNYSIEYGADNKDMAGVELYDQMTDLQILNFPITITYPLASGGTKTVTLTSKDDPSVLWNGDAYYSVGMTDILRYKLPEEGADKAGKGKVTVSYSTTIIDKQTAIDQRVYGIQSVKNRASAENKADETMGDVTFPDEPKQEKKITSSTKEDGKLVPGSTITYTMTYGSKDIPLKGMTISDEMTKLQNLNAGSIKIKYGTGSEQDMPSDWIKWQAVPADQFSSQTATVFEHTFGDEAANTYGPITITYTTTLATADQIKNLDISGDQTVANTFKVNNNPTSTYETIPTNKPNTVKKTVKNTTTNSNTWKPGDRLEYTIVFEGDRLAGSTLTDYATDIQILSDAGIKLEFYDSTEAGATATNTVTLAANGTNIGADFKDNSTAGYTEDDMAEAQTHFHTDSKLLFTYDVPTNSTAKRIVATYTMTILDENFAHDILDMYGLKGTNNSAETSKGGNGGTNGNTDYGVKPPIPQTKEVSPADVDTDGDEANGWQPGQQLTYTLTYGNGKKNMNGVYIYDAMTDLQNLTSDITIKYYKLGSDGTTFELITDRTDTIPMSNGGYGSGEVWHANHSDTAKTAATADLSGYTYGAGLTDVFSYTLPDNLPNNGKVKLEITYTTRVIGKDTASKCGVYDVQKVVNNFTVDGETRTTEGDVPFEDSPKPKKSVNPEDADTVDTSKAETEGWHPEEELTYTIRFGDKYTYLNGGSIFDRMANIQTLKDDTKVLITWNTYDENKNITGTKSMYMPVDSSGSGAGVVWNNGSNHLKEGGKDIYTVGYNGQSDQKTVFNYTFPDPTDTVTFKGGSTGEIGEVYGPVTITYETVVMSQEDAERLKLYGTQTVDNTFTFNNESAYTVGDVPYEDEAQHYPRLQKTGYVNATTGEPVFEAGTAGTVTDKEGKSHNIIVPPTGAKENIDISERRVTWVIKVDAAPGSTYPITSNYNGTTPDNQGINVYELITGIESNINSDFSGTGAALYRDGLVKAVQARVVEQILDEDTGEVKSTRTLYPGTDYTIIMNGGTSEVPDNIQYHFDKINGPVYIYFDVYFNQDIIGEYHMLNKVNFPYNVDRNEVEIGGYNESVSVKKEGEVQEAPDGTNRVIKWKVILNPDSLVVEPDIEEVWFTDTLPDGLALIDYLEWINNNNVELSTPSIQAHVSGRQNMTDPGPYENTEGKKGVIPVEVEDNVIQNVDVRSHDWNYANYSTLSGNTYTITYYTYITDEKWAEITSTESGSQNVVNTATFTDGGTRIFSKTTEVTVTADEYLTKKDISNVKTGTTDLQSDDLDYLINVNPHKYMLNDGEPLFLMDTIPTSMNLRVPSIKVFKATSASSAAMQAALDAAGKTEADRSIIMTEYGTLKTELLGQDVTNRVTISYNDDSRVLSFSGLEDEEQYYVFFTAGVRSVGGSDTQTFNNTVTLTGKGSHSYTEITTHKTEEFHAEAHGGMGMIKIDEDNAKKTLEGAVFELYEVTTDPVTDSDFEPYTENGQELERVKASKGKATTFQVRQIISNTADENGQYTSDKRGVISFGTFEFDANKLYYWVEKKAPDGYTADLDVPHYFVMYHALREDDLEAGQTTDELPTLTQANMLRAWALDDWWSESFDITIASYALNATWYATNSQYRSITATKKWEGDSNNIYKLRPEDGVKFTLVRINPDGTTTNLDTRVIRGGNENQWPSYTWNKLPIEDEQGNHYKYTVVEEFVENYYPEYSDNGKGIEGGSLYITNHMTPGSTSITVEKLWQTGGDVPQSIKVKLVQIYTDPDGNVVKMATPDDLPTGWTDRYDLEATLRVGAGNKWTYTWNELPTRANDGTGATYSYTVEETKIYNAANGEYDPVTTENFIVDYSDDGKGIVKGTITITNIKPGALKIIKKVAVNGVEVQEGDNNTLADGTYTFNILDDKGVKVKSVKIKVENGVSEPLIVNDLPEGTYTVREEMPTNGTNLLTGTPKEYQLTVRAGVTADAEIESATFTNNRDTTKLTVKKKWYTDDVDWPKDATATITLVENGTALKETDRPDATVTLTEDQESYTWTGLDPEKTYTVTEAPMSGYVAEISEADENRVITVTNKESRDISFTKSWAASVDTAGKTWTAEIKLMQREKVFVEYGEKVTGMEPGPWTETGLTKIVNNANPSAAFNGLPKYRHDGTTIYEIEYTVKESGIILDGLDVTNLYSGVVTGSMDEGFSMVNTPARRVPVQKLWDGDIPVDVASVEFTLLRNGSADFTHVDGVTDVAPITLPIVDENGNKVWSGAFEDLPQDGTYTIKETKVTYTNKKSVTDETIIQRIFGAVTGSDGDTLTITNKKETIDIPVHKTWEDIDPNTSGLNVSFTLYSVNPSTGKETKVTKDADGNSINATINNVNRNREVDGVNWSTQWVNLPRYDANGVEILYRVRETRVQANGTTYTTTKGIENNWGEGTWADVEPGEVTDITNKPVKAELVVRKRWSSTIPENAKVTIALLKDGQPVQVKDVVEGSSSTANFVFTLPKNNEWYDSISGLQKYDREGNLVNWSVKETLITYTDGGTTYTLYDVLPTGVTEDATHKLISSVFTVQGEDVFSYADGSDIGTQTINNNLPEVHTGDHLDIGLEKVWKDGSKVTKGSSATFTLHQERLALPAKANQTVVRIYAKDKTTVLHEGVLDSTASDAKLEFTGSTEHMEVEFKYVKTDAQAFGGKPKANGASYSGTVSVTIDGTTLNDNQVLELYVDKSASEFAKLPYIYNDGTWKTTYPNNSWTVTLTDDPHTNDANNGDWKYIWRNMPQIDKPTDDSNGYRYRYYITEDSSLPAEFTGFAITSQDGSNKQTTMLTDTSSITATNSKPPHLDVTKVWSDGKKEIEPPEDMRKVYFKLYSVVDNNGTPNFGYIANYGISPKGYKSDSIGGGQTGNIPYFELTYSEGKWSTLSFVNLPTTYEYYIVECDASGNNLTTDQTITSGTYRPSVKFEGEAVDAEHHFSVEDSGTATITNTTVFPDKVPITVAKAWNNIDESHIWPEGVEVEVGLYRVQGKTQTLVERPATVEEANWANPVTLTKTTQETYTWQDVPTKDGDDLIEYIVKETAVTKNSESIVGQYPLQSTAAVFAGTATLTNTEKTLLNVDKAWQNNSKAPITRENGTITYEVWQNSANTTVIPSYSIDVSGIYRDWYGTSGDIPETQISGATSVKDGGTVTIVISTSLNSNADLTGTLNFNGNVPISDNIETSGEGATFRRVRTIEFRNVKSSLTVSGGINFQNWGSDYPSINVSVSDEPVAGTPGTVGGTAVKVATVVMSKTGVYSTIESGFKGVDIKKGEGDWTSEIRGLPLKSVSGYTTTTYTYTVNETDLPDDADYYGISPTDPQQPNGATITITNKEKPKGSIVVTKTALKNAEPDIEAVGKTVKIGLFNADQSTADPRTEAIETRTISLASLESGAVVGGSTTFDDLLYGTYYVYEVDAANKAILNNETATVGSIVYTVDQSDAAATVNSATEVQKQISNTRTVVLDGNLKIAKTTFPVDSTQEFTFNVKLTAPTGGSLATSYTTVRTGTNAGEGTQNVTSGTAFTVTLKGGDTWQINGLPVDTTYEVTEDSVVGWTNTVKSGETGSIVAGDTKEASFTNVYSEITAAPGATKQLNGRDWSDSDSFKFTLAADSADAATTAAVNAGKVVLPDTTEVTVTKPDTGDSVNFSFNAITFKDAGTYVFTITEDTTGTTENKKDGVTYDTTPVKVTYVVEKSAEGVLSVKSTTYDPAGKTFTNTYEATGNVTFQAKKVFDHGTLSSEHPFTFKLTQVTAENSTTPATSKDVGTGEGKIPALKLNGFVTKSTTANSGSEQTVTFDEITFTKDSSENETGEYWFLLEEVVPDEAVDGIKDGIKYDTAKKWIKVMVEDDGKGTLTVTKDPNPASDDLDGTWTNKQLGSVKVTKVFSGVESLPAGFKITASWTEDGSEKTQEFTTSTAGMTGDGSDSNPYTWQIDDLPVGTVVTFTEEGIQIDGYNLKVNGTATTAENATTTATVAAGNEIATGRLVNVYEKKPGDLELTKKVEGDVPAGDENKKFEFTITLTAPDGVELAASYNVVNTVNNVDGTPESKSLDWVTESDVIQTNKKGSFKVELAKDETITIKDLPAGTGYEIVETSYSTEGYSPSITKGSLTGIITGGTTSKEEVEVTNKFSAGALVVTKAIEGNAAKGEDEFSFKVELTKPEGTTDSGSFKIEPRESAAQDINFGDDVVNLNKATVEFYMKGGESATFSNLPVGTEFKVTEIVADKNGYETTVKKDGVVEADKVVEGSIARGSSATAAFTNTKATTGIDATKVWTSGEQTMPVWPEDVASVEFTVYKTVEGNTTEVTQEDISDYVTEEEKEAFSATKTINKDTEQRKVSWDKLPARILVPAVEADTEKGIEAGPAHWADVTYSVKETKVTFTDTTRAPLETEESINAAFGATWNATGKIITNNVPTVTVSGTKTWIAAGTHNNGEDVTLKLTRTAGTATEIAIKSDISSGLEWVTALSDDTSRLYQPSWNGGTYTYSNLPKYNAEGKVYTYEVAEASFKVGSQTYTVTRSGTTYTVEPADKFRVAQSGNDITNTELTETTVTKQWAGATKNDDSKISSITYKLTRYITTTGDSKVSDVPFVDEVTVTKSDEKYTVSGTYDGLTRTNTNWNVTWSNLDAYGEVQDNTQPPENNTSYGPFTYVAEEIGFVYDEVPYKVVNDVVSVDEAKLPTDETAKAALLAKAHQFWKTTSSVNGTTTAITNTLDETTFTAIKLWEENYIPIQWQDGVSITLSLYRKTVDNNITLSDADFGLYTLTATKTAGNDLTITASPALPTGVTATIVAKTIGEGADAKTCYEIKFTGLERQWKDTANGTYADWVYFLEETNPAGFTASYLDEKGDETHGTVAKDGYTIKNTKYSVSLPSTGGPGTTGLYIVGSILTLLALVLLITKKRTEGQGID